MRRWKLITLTVGMVMGVSAMATPAYALEIFKACDDGMAKSSVVCAAEDDDDAMSMTKTIVNLMLFALGITAVFLIIHSGLKYVTSRGDPANIKSAKDTLLYAVIGLVVAILAFTIVNFVLSAFR